MTRFFINNTYYFITVPTVKLYPYFNNGVKKFLILKRLIKIKEKYSLFDFNFGIISNHYHFISYFKNSAMIPKILQLINGGTAYDFNRITGNKKPIWGEYHIYLANNEILLNKIKGYVVGNPLKHHEVKNLKELEKYAFSSFQSLINQLGKNQATQCINSVITIDEGDFFRTLPD